MTGKRIDYRKGAEARKNFEEGMRKLFRVPKSALKPKLKKEGTSK